jgi:very-short-patch-repair endonuclease
MEHKHNKKLVPIAKILRKNMTKEERHLWYDFLRTYPVKFLRQKPIGNYIVDFYCAKANLVIELDGSHHYDTEGLRKDKTRTEFLKSYGINVLRITNLEIHRNFRGVCEYIDNSVQQSLRQPKG